MIFSDFGMDTASLAGALEVKLAAVRRAGFSQVMIAAGDVVGHPSGVDAGVRAVRGSGLRVRVRRDRRQRGPGGHRSGSEQCLASSVATFRMIAHVLLR